MLQNLGSELAVNYLSVNNADCGVTCYTCDLNIHLQNEKPTISIISCEASLDSKVVNL